MKAVFPPLKGYNAYSPTTYKFIDAIWSGQPLHNRLALGKMDLS